MIFFFLFFKSIQLKFIRIKKPTLGHPILFPSIKSHFFLITGLICSVVLPQKGVARSYVSDSLLEIAQTQAGNEKLETLKKLAYSNQDISEGVQFARILLAEAQKQNNLEYQSLGLAKIANHYSAQFETDSFFITFEPFEKFCFQHKYYKHYFIVVEGYLKRQTQRGNYALALQKANEIYELAKTIKDNETIGISLRNIASVYCSMTQYDEAVNFQNQSLSILRTIPQPNFYLTNAYLELGNYYSNLKQNEKVVCYADSVLLAIKEAQQKLPDYQYNHEHFLALAFYTSAYTFLGQTDKALYYLNQAEAYINANGPEYDRYMIDQIAYDFYNLTGNYEKALEYNQRNIDFLASNKMNIDIGLRLKQRGELLTKMHNYEDAVDFYARAIEVNDSIDKQQYAHQINELRTIYEVDKLELITEKTKLKLKNSRMFAGLLSLLAVALVAFVLVILNHQKKLRLKNRSLYRQIVEQKRLNEQFNEQIQDKKAEQPSPETADTGNDKVKELIVRLNTLMDTEALFVQADLNRKKLSDVLGTNETYLFEAIKQTFNLTFNEYLNRLRLDHARDLLAQASCELTIEALAIDSGFGSRNTFYRLFRERYGLTPVEFRKLACRKDV